jgi:two-component system, chemotaxis family, chemotaxis protein CheY
MSSAKQIIIADDSPIIRKLLYQLLTREGYTVTVTEDGAELLEKFYSGNYHLVILDLNMPNISGLKVLEEIKKDPGLSKIPVIILSSLSGDQNVQRGLQMGADYYFIKPPEEEKFLYCIKSLLEK